MYLTRFLPFVKESLKHRKKALLGSMTFCCLGLLIVQKGAEFCLQESKIQQISSISLTDSLFDHPQNQNDWLKKALVCHLGKF
jgi:hypothetical protein